MNNNPILLIAGFDSSIKSGITTDILTAQKLETNAISTVSCLTIQNDKKVEDISYPTNIFLRKQIKSALKNNQIKFAKIGMVGSKENIKIITKILKNKNIKIILDPIIKSSSKYSLLEKNALPLFKKELINLSFLITPNINEAQILANMPIKNLREVRIAAQKISNLGAKNILITGGHLTNKRITHFLLTDKKEELFFSNKRLIKGNFRGTGCKLSAAITCFLNKGFDLKTAIRKGNNYTYNSIKKM